MLEDFVLVTVAAQELGLTRAAIWKAIERGRLKARKVGTQYFIARPELERFKAEPRHRGRPRRPPPPA